MKGNTQQDIASVATSLNLSEEDVKAAHKRGMFKLQITFGKARSAKNPKAATKKAAKKPSGPKATNQDLEAHLNTLDSQDATIVERLEGMKGNAKQDIAAVASSLNLSEEDVKAAHKRGMFKLRITFGKARKA